LSGRDERRRCPERDFKQDELELNDKAVLTASGGVTVVPMTPAAMIA
jgi:hypothetical protein